MAVVAVFNQKGGVGKTTSCLNIAAALARQEKRPLAIDLDPQSHLTLSCGVRAESGDESIAAFYREDKPLADLVQELANGVRLIPAHMELSKVDALYGKSTSITSRLKQGLQQSLAWDDNPILIDCCPMLGVLTLNALLAADKVIIPVSADYLSQHGVHRLDSALNVLEKKLQRKFERRIVVTRFDSRRKLSFDIYDQLRERYGSLLCKTRIGETVALATSPMHGLDVFAYAPNSPGAVDYKALAKELMDSGFI